MAPPASELIGRTTADHNTWFYLALHDDAEWLPADPIRRLRRHVCLGQVSFNRRWRLSPLVDRRLPLTTRQRLDAAA